MGTLGVIICDCLVVSDDYISILTSVSITDLTRSNRLTAAF